MRRIIDLIVADARTSAPAVLRSADVVLLDSECECPQRWPGDALARWPGSLIAAAYASGGSCVVMARGQEPVIFRVSAGGGPCSVLGCALTAYWWTVSGRPLAELADGRFILIRVFRRSVVLADGGQLAPDIFRVRGACRLESGESVR